MHKSKFINLLRTFSREEMGEFRKYAASPYFNKGRDLTSLLKILDKHSPGFHSPSLTKLNIFAELYPGKQYKDNVLKTMLSFLNSLAESFLAQKMFDSNKFEVQLAKLSAYHNRDLEKLFIKDINKTFSNFDELGIADPIDAEKCRYELATIETTFYNGRRNMNIKHKKYDVVSSAANLFLMEYFVCYADESAKAHFINQPMPELFELMHNSINFEHIIGGLNNENELSRLKLKFCYALYRARKFTDKESYFEAKKVFYNNSGIFPKTIRQSFIFLLINCISYLMRFLPANELEMENYRNIKYMFENDLHVYPGDNILPAGLFKNALMLSMKFEDHDFTGHLLDKHVYKTHRKFHEPFLNFGLALIEFNGSNFGAALENLQKVDFIEPALTMDVKILTSKILYEMDYIENAFIYIRSFRKFLSENKHTGKSLKDKYNKYIRFYTILLHTKSGKNQNRKQEIIEQIKNEPVMESRQWLINKFLEL